MVLMVRVKGGMSLRNGMWHLLADCHILKMAQRNKLHRKAFANLCLAFFGANLEE